MGYRTPRSLLLEGLVYGEVMGKGMEYMTLVLVAIVLSSAIVCPFDTRSQPPCKWTRSIKNIFSIVDKSFSLTLKFSFELWYA